MSCHSLVTYVFILINDTLSIFIHTENGENLMNYRSSNKNKSLYPPPQTKKKQIKAYILLCFK